MFSVPVPKDVFQLLCAADFSYYAANNSDCTKVVHDRFTPLSMWVYGLSTGVNKEDLLTLTQWYSRRSIKLDALFVLDGNPAQKQLNHLDSDSIQHHVRYWYKHVYQLPVELPPCVKRINRNRLTPEQVAEEIIKTCERL